MSMKVTWELSAATVIHVTDGNRTVGDHIHQLVRDGEKIVCVQGLTWRLMYTCSESMACFPEQTFFVKLLAGLVHI